MKHYVKTAAVAIFVSLVGCGHNSTVPPPSPDRMMSSAASQARASSVVTTGDFTEYSLPSRAHPSDLIRGPYDTLYFTTTEPPGNPAVLYQMKDATGAIHSFGFGMSWQSSGNDGVIAAYNSVWFFAIAPALQDEDFLGAFTPGGTQFHDTGANERQFTNIISDSLGRLWIGFCADPCSSPTAGLLEAITNFGSIYAVVNLDDYFVPKSGTPGPNGLYYTAVYAGPPPNPNPDARVYVLSLAGTFHIVHRYALPIGSLPSGIVTGSDHNLWIAEPGINKIARLTPTGLVTQFALPTANAGPDRITYGVDGALWFTETTANKIGRISTTGSVTEFPIPTLNSGATGITTCTTLCGTHGGVWFTETKANKIGRFNAPM